MENSQNARYAHYPEKSDYFLDPNQTLTKEKIQEAFAKSNLLKNQNKSDFNKENINNINIPPSKKKQKRKHKNGYRNNRGAKINRFNSINFD